MFSGALLHSLPRSSVGVGRWPNCLVLARSVGSFRDMAMQIVPATDLQLTIRYYWMPISLDVGELQELLPGEVMDSLKLIVLSASPDVVCLGLTTSGQFSSASSYTLVRPNTCTNVVAWKKVWKSSRPQRFSLLLWKTRWNCMKTNQFLHLSGVLLEPRSGLCGYMEEMTIHALRDCRATSKIWNVLLLLVKQLVSLQVLMCLARWMII